MTSICCNRPQVDGVHAALPVRQGLRNVIGEDTDTANTKICPRPKAPDRNSQILREVVSVLKKQARNRSQGFIEAELLPGPLNFIPAHHAGGERQILQNGRDPGGGHHHLLQHDVGIGSGRCPGNQKERHRGEKKPGD